MLGDLSKKYESNGDPGCISDGWGDAGGKSYGMYQLASAVGSVHSYLGWLQRKGYWFAPYLAADEVGSVAFDRTWKNLANGENREDFAKSQHDFIKATYYDEASFLLRRAMFDIEKHTETMKDVVWSAAVQYGPGAVVELLDTACRILAYPNLSYVDAPNFDRAMIKTIYEVRATEDWTNGSPDLREGLYHRFRMEGAEALKRLEQEYPEAGD